MQAVGSTVACDSFRFLILPANSRSPPIPPRGANDFIWTLRFAGSGLTGWINGGAGVVLSRAMVERMVMSECLHRYAWRWRRTSLSGADVVLACCVADADPIVSTGDNTRVHLPGYVS
jgi:hypothetical protein